MSTRSRQFWTFQAIFWSVAGMALFISGATQMPLVDALVRNLFLFLAGFMSSFFLAMAIDELRWMPMLRLRLASYLLAYLVAVFCVIAINAISFTLRGVGLGDMSFGQWLSGALNLGLIYAFWSELFIQQIYFQEEAATPKESKDLIVEYRGTKIPVPISDIDSFVAAGDYVEIHFDGKTGLRRQTLQSVEASHDKNLFVRIHRSALVNRGQVRSVKPLGKGRYQVTLRGGSIVDSSRSYSETVKELASHAA